MTDNAKPADPDTVLDPAHALIPSVQRVNEARVARGFWPKIRRTAARIPFADQALSVWYAARDPETPPAAKGLMLGALAYFVMPIDAVPDVFAGITAMIAMLGANIKRRHRDAAAEALDRLKAD